MKFNLKNRPKFEELEYSALTWGKVKETIEWFEGFEKELREKLAKAEQEKKRLKVEEPENRVAWNFWDDYARAIKEILGDERE